jgi:hypothetical protein
MNKHYEKMAEYCLKQHEFETLQEMADACHVSLVTITRVCARYKIKVYSPKDIKVNFLKAHAKTLSIEKLAAQLKVKESYILKLGRDHDIELFRDPQPRKPRAPKAKAPDTQVAPQPIPAPSEELYKEGVREHLLALKKKNPGKLREAITREFEKAEIYETVLTTGTIKRPPAVYNQTFSSDIVKEYYAQEHNIKTKE